MKVVVLIGVLGCFILAEAGHDHGELRQIFKEWKIKFGKSGGTLRNDVQRFRLFRKSADTIEHINSIQNEWTAGFTQFSDMTDSEKASYTGLLFNETESEKIPSMSSGDLKADYDPTDPDKQYWEMGPAKNQWSCGSCWSFAAVGAIEGRHLKEHGEFRDLSEQTMLDCVFEGSRDGCKGGWSDMAVRWAGSSSPVSSSPNYGYLPYRADNTYRAKDGECTETSTPYPNGLRRAKPYSYSARWRDQHDAGLQHALATEGPVIVYIYSSWALPFYTTGTYRGDGCGTDPTPNHAVVAAGYEKDYWYIKNSWGSSWGYSGYVYFSRGWDNLCSVAKHRKVIEWRPNQHYDICADTHPRDRTPCVDDKILAEDDCLARECCYDATYAGTQNQCFAKGKMTIYDDEGHRRVLYGSVAYFTEHGFTGRATAAEVEIGTWILYDDGAWWNGPSKVITPADGKVSLGFESARLITSKLSLHLFEYSDFLGDVFTLSGYTDQLGSGQLNDDVSSFITFGGPWDLCSGANQQGPCYRVEREATSHQQRHMSNAPCDDCLSSVA